MTHCLSVVNTGTLRPAQNLSGGLNSTRTHTDWSANHPLRGLLIAQFFGAFNDNVWKLMVALLAIQQATEQMALGPEMKTSG